MEVWNREGREVSIGRGRGEEKDRREYMWKETRTEKKRVDIRPA